MFKWLKRLGQVIDKLPGGKYPVPPAPQLRGKWMILEQTDIIGRQGGRKRNRVHVYRRPYGLPIRLCDWVGVDNDEIDVFGTIPSGDLMKALAILRGDYDKQICGHCWAIVHGIRGSIGMENLGHGKGAPLPSDYENIKHECKTCGHTWEVRMKLVGEESGIRLPTYTGADTFICPNCASQNTIAYSGRPKQEQ